MRLSTFIVLAVIAVLLGAGIAFVVRARRAAAEAQRKAAFQAEVLRLALAETEVINLPAG